MNSGIVIISSNDLYWGIVGKVSRRSKEGESILPDRCFVWIISWVAEGNFQSGIDTCDALYSIQATDSKAFIKSQRHFAMPIIR